jgi:hypothetical protein
MRIVHVITRLILGGAQENTLLTVDGLHHHHGDDVTLITGPAEGPEGDLFDGVSDARSVGFGPMSSIPIARRPESSAGPPPGPSGFRPSSIRSTASRSDRPNPARRTPFTSVSNAGRRGGATPSSASATR